MKNLLYILMAVAMLTTSCKPDDSSQDGATAMPYDLRDGLWWVNEGAFNGNNGSIDVITSDGRIAKDAFKQSNGTGLGDVLQRVTIINLNSNTDHLEPLITNVFFGGHFT